MRFTASILCVLFVGLACSGEQYNRKTADIHDIIGETYRLSTSYERSRLNKDTGIRNPNTNKWIVYFNRNGCTPCALKSLKHWKDIIADFDSLRLKAELIFIINAAADDEDLTKVLEQEAFDYPILCDEQGEFERYNLLPANDLLNTFVLDGNNVVRIVGTPLISDKMKNVFFNYLIANDVEP